MPRCACKGLFLERFIQPSILMLLLQKPMHGFSILKELKQSSIMDYSTLDPSGLYRMLKKLEEEGVVTSYIEGIDAIRGKRVYEITERGRSCLYYWKVTLNDYARHIAALAESIPEELREGLLEHL